MEVVPCVQKAGGHAASLLARLNLQREQAQFCDCVVRQMQNPGQLYPAHRCVLAASSPVFASILSSTGVLVELQAPCLSDPVLALLLEYIYTGDLPNTHTQQQYDNLLTAAFYLQMDELQETLRTEVNPTDHTSDTCNVNPLERKDQYCDEIDTCRSSSKNDANHCSGSPLRNESTASSVNAGNCRQVTYPTSHDLIQNKPLTTEVHRVSRVDKEVQGDQLHSADTVKPESWQTNTEEEPVRTFESRRSLYSLCTAEMQEEETNRVEKTQQLCLTVKSKSEETQTNRNEEIQFKVSPLQCSSSSSLSTPPCCGAVPVIRHSSSAAMVEVSIMPPYNPVPQAAVGSSRASHSRSGITDGDRIVEVIAAEKENHYEAQNQDSRNNKDQIGTQSWHENSSDQCEMQDFCYKSSEDQSDNSSNTDHDEHMGNGFTHATDHSDITAPCDSFQNKNHKKHFRHNPVPWSTDCSREFKYKSDDFPSKHQRLDHSDYHNDSMASAAEEQLMYSQDPRVLVSLSVQDSDTGRDSHCEDLCPKVETKHSCSSRCPAEMNRQDSQGTHHGPKNDWYPNLHRAEACTKDSTFSQHEHDDKDIDMDNVTGCTSLENENISGTEISEPHLPFPMPMDNNMYNVVGPSYHGHLHYHCLPQEDTDLSYRDHKHSHPSQAYHSDQSSEEEEVGTFASPGLSLLRQHFATTDQVLLLDISAKPAELLVSYRQRSNEEEKWTAFSQKETPGNVFVDNDREQRNGATSTAGVNKRKFRAKIKLRAESFDEAYAKACIGETNVEDTVGKQQSRSGAEVIHKAGVVEGDNKTAAFTACSPPSVPDSVQAPVSSSLSVCIPSTLSASMPTNVSAHLSTPVHHPFQCSLCDRSFSQRGSLNRHVRSHLGVRPFPCPRCPMTFSRQYRVSEHMRVHQRCVLGSEVQIPPCSST